MALSYFPEFGGGFVESIVTSINGYFLVTVSENGCVYCFFIFLWFSWFVCFGGFGGMVKHRIIFFKKGYLWPMTFSIRYFFHLTI